MESEYESPPEFVYEENYDDLAQPWHNEAVPYDAFVYMIKGIKKDVPISLKYGTLINIIIMAINKSEIELPYETLFEIGLNLDYKMLISLSDEIFLARLCQDEEFLELKKNKDKQDGSTGYKIPTRKFTSVWHIRKNNHTLPDIGWILRQINPNNEIILSYGTLFDILTYSNHISYLTLFEIGLNLSASSLAKLCVSHDFMKELCSDSGFWASKLKNTNRNAVKK